MSSAARGDTFTGNTEEEPGQSELWDFDMEFSRIPAWWDFTDPHQGSSWNIYVTGEVLESGILESPEYSTVEFLVTTGEDDYPKEASYQDVQASRQYLESHLRENGDKQAFDTVARALDTPEESDVWEEVSDGKVPLMAEFYFEDSAFQVEKSYNRKGYDGPFYPVKDYFARERRPGWGQQVSCFDLRNNIRGTDVEAFEEVVGALKEQGATLYVTGGILESGDYSDIDIAVDGLHWPRETFSNRTGDSPYPQRGEYSGLPRHLAFDETDLEMAIDGLGVDPEVHEPSDGSDMNVSHGYNAVGLLYSFSLDGTEFDIGYDEEPFISRGFDPLDTDVDTRFAKI